MHTGTISIATTARTEFVDITPHIRQVIGGLVKVNGVCVLYNPHTTAGLTINEGADPCVQDDISGVLNQIIPDKSYPYTHMEGNSPAHVKASLMGSSVTVFIDSGQLQLGTWQRIFFCEFDGPRSRTVRWRLLSAT